MTDPVAPLPARSMDERIFQTSLDLILTVDGRGTIKRVSPSSLRLLGWTPQEMVGHSGREFIYPEDLDSTRTQMRRARRGHLTTNFDCRYIHRNGQIVPMAWTGVWSEQDREHFFIGRDMSERIAIEDRLSHLQRMKALGQLTGGIAHDFNNLLGIITASLDLLLQMPALPAEASGLAQSAINAAERGADLVRQLLAFARQQPLKPQRIDTNGLIGNLALLLGRTIGQNIQVTFRPGADTSPVHADPANLEAAIANFAVNARDAMPEGGRLLIETGNSELDADYAQRNPGVSAGEYVVISVTDTGTGIPPAVLDRIFEPFFTTKEAGKGNGLGLSMVFGFVQQSGGHVKAYSEVGHGTTIRMYLPRAGEAAASPPTETEEVPTSAAGRERILVVEDNDGVRQLVLLQLARLGYDVLEASAPAQALKLLDSGEKVDLLFTDIIMPGGMNGHVLAREAASRRPGLKVLFTSGFPGAVLAHDSATLDAGNLLSKPYRLQELAEKIRSALRHSQA